MLLVSNADIFMSKFILRVTGELCDARSGGLQGSNEDSKCYYAR